MQSITNCKTCNSQLQITNPRRKFCSIKCKNAFYLNNDYAAQQIRGKSRKMELILRSGGKCEACGYCKNTAALSFHHIDPSKKSFPLDLRRLSNSSWERINSEYAKCRLLCLNCHAEHHHPDS